MRKKLLLIDPGHGGIDENGFYTSCPNPDKNNKNTWYKCMWNGDRWINEGDWNYQISASLIEMIDKIGDFDVDVTKYTQEDTSLDSRVKKEHELLPDLFLSIHFNYFSNYSVKGTEVFAYKNAGKGSRKAANIMARNLMLDIEEEPLRTESTERFYKEANYKVLRETKGSAILAELGFFSNSDTQRMMKYKEYQDKIVLSLYKSINQYFNELH
tara:strand:+ start:1220 stop:1858 length:639 start_codon:yes stop_codon:yes gene_type:complete